MPPRTTLQALPDLLAAAGEVGGLLRARNWDGSALGDPANWPPSLCTALSICLHSAAVSAVYWGRDFVVFYNDAYAPVLTNRHPEALGQPLREV